MQISSTNDIPGYKTVKHLGMAQGITVRMPTIAQGFSSTIKAVIGGRIGAYVDMCETARQDASDLMVRHAEQLGANAIIGFRYTNSTVGMQAEATEVVAYGTAVVVQKEA